MRQFQASRRARAKRLEMLRKVAGPHLTHPLLHTSPPTPVPTFSLHTALPHSAPHGDLLQHASHLLEAQFTLAQVHTCVYKLLKRA